MAALIGSPEELKVQRRISSESLSAAFEQSLSRGGEEFSLAGSEAGSPEVTQPARKRNGITVQVPKGFEDDVLSLQDDSEESWLISSPGPPSSTSHTFDFSPPRRGAEAMKKQKLLPTNKDLEPIISSDENGGGRPVKSGLAAANRAAVSQTKKPTKIPRVAMLASKGSAGKVPPPAPKPAAAPSPSKLGTPPAKAASPGPKKASSVRYDLNGRVIPNPRATGSSQDSAASARSRIPKQDLPQETAKSASKGPVKSPTKTSPTKASLVREQSIDAERENAANSRIPSRPGSAAVRGGRRPSTASARKGKAGTKAAADENGNGTHNDAQLLTAISGPEEDLIAAVSGAPDFVPAADDAAVAADVSPSPAKTQAAQSFGTQEAGNAANGIAADCVTDPADSKSATSLRSQSPEFEQPNSAAEPHDNGSGVQQSTCAGEYLQEKPSGSVRTAPPKIPTSPFAGDATDEVNETNEDADKPAEAPVPVAKAPERDEERPGVGRKKAEELPDKGYQSAGGAQKGCCGCVVM